MDAIRIGSECRDESEASCSTEADGRAIDPGKLDAGPGLGRGVQLDARIPMADANTNPDSNVSQAGDAGVLAPHDAMVWELPDLLNPSFELTAGSPGDVTALSLSTGTEIAPWYSCQPIGAGPGLLTGVRAEESVSLPAGESDAPVRARDGRTFLAMQYFATLLPLGLLQELRSPLRAGAAYGMAIDVRTNDPGGRLSLQLLGNNAGCAGPFNATRLAETAPLTTRGWQTVCMRFTAPIDLSHLILVENASSALSGDRLFVDHIRSVASCPPGSALSGEVP